jgi:hypothetical protein
MGALKYLATFLATVSLGGCSVSNVGPPSVEKYFIKEISFYGSHEERRAKTSRFVPDTWYILFCETEKAASCFTRKITHAPWKWQAEGSKVTITWQKRGDSFSQWWDVVSVVDTATGEPLQM